MYTVFILVQYLLLQNTYWLNIIISMLACNGHQQYNSIVSLHKGTTQGSVHDLHVILSGPIGLWHNNYALQNGIFVWCCAHSSFWPVEVIPNPLYL